MRTTLNLDDHLMDAVRQRAAETRRTITEIVETGVRELLERESRPNGRHRLRWITVCGDAPPTVDLTDRDALLDRMEGRT
jgi:hypothetical protein